MVTLAPYGFFWFQLCEPEAVDIDECRGSGIRDAGGRGNLALAAARPHPIGARARCAAGFSGRPALVCRAQRGADHANRRRYPAQRQRSRPGTRVGRDQGPAASGNLFAAADVKWTRFDPVRQNPNALAAVRRGPREGTLLDAAADPGFIAALLENLRAAQIIEADRRRLEFRPAAVFSSAPPHSMEDVRAVDTEQSNTTVLVGSDYVVKLFRRLEPGINPEIEIGRFLTETVAFPNAPPFLGTVELEERRDRSAVAVVHGFVENQGDAWTVTSAYLDRFVEEQRLLTAEQRKTASSRRPMGSACIRSAGGSPSCSSRWRAATTLPISRLNRSPRGYTAGGPNDLLRRAGRTLDELARRRPELRRNRSSVGRSAAVLPRIRCRPACAELLPETVEAHQNPPSRRFSSRPNADRQGRRLHHRFRGRAAAQHRRAPTQGAGCPRRRRADPLDRLFGDGGARARARIGSRRGRQDRARARSLARARRSRPFSTAYRQALGDTVLWPASRPDADHLLDFFLLEKAFYEIEYELAHRPGWLRVPVAGTLRILSRSQQGSA